MATQVELLTGLVNVAIPEVYQKGMSYYEVLTAVVNKVNELIEQSNEYFSEDVQTTMTNILNGWKDDGTLSALIADAVLDIGDRQYTEQNYVTNGESITNSLNALDVGVTARLAETENKVIGTISVLNEGAVGDGVTDDTLAIQEASNKLQPYEELLFPHGYQFRTTNTITVRENRHVTMHSPIIFDNASPMTALKIGDETKNNITVNLTIMVRRKNSGVGWLNETDIGVKLLNCYHCKINLHEVYNFTIGAQLMGDGSGFVYNTLQLDYIVNNKFGLDLTNINSGWCNENLFLGGRFTVFSGTNTNGYSRYGVRITSADLSYPHNDQNVFIKPSFELKGVNAGDGEALGVLIEHGQFNEFLSYRDEGNTKTGRILNDSSGNHFKGLWSFNSVDDFSTSASNYVESLTSPAKYRTGVEIFNSGNLVKKFCLYNGVNFFHIPNIHFVTLTSNEVLRSGKLNVNDDFLKFNQGYLMGVFVNTKEAKKFIVRINGSPKGRLCIVCFDDLGNQITTENSVNGDLINGFETSTKYGGSFIQTKETVQDSLFKVSEDVKKIQLIFSYVNLIPELKGFSIESLQTGARTQDTLASVYSGYENIVDGANIAEIPPTNTGFTWKQGKIIYNVNPTSGGYLGWVCVADGAPGTWKGFGMIA